eukprot:532127_1
MQTVHKNMLFVVTLFLLNFKSVYGGFTYYELPLSFEDAKEFCSSVGTSLATILTDADRIMALATISERAAPWIGLEHAHASNPGGKCYFHYPAEGDPSLCPLSHSSKCVDFWVNENPIYLNAGGYECAAYYPLEHHKNGAVNNDVDCNTARPFLCHTPDEICDVEHFDCSGTAIPWCSESPRCACQFDASGESMCVRGICAASRCDQANGNEDCPDNYVCTTSGCCGSHTSCQRLCGEDLRRRMSEEEESIDETKCPCFYVYCPSCD